MTKITEKNFINKISKILSIKNNKLLKIDDFSKIKKWDSLVHLQIITVLDSLFGAKLSKIKNIHQITSIKKITQLLKKSKLL